MTAVFCIDIGNTHADYGLIRDDRLVNGGRVAMRELDHPNTGLQPLLPDLINTEVDGISYASVVPSATKRLLPLLATLDFPVFALSGKQCPGLGIRYPRPEEVGADMLAASIAVQARFGVPTLVLSLGTAIAAGLVTEAGYEGGLIAPGLSMMCDALHEKTALLPRLELEHLYAATGLIGRSTEDAMAIGCRIGFVGMMRGIVEHVEKELAKQGEASIRIAVTGGSARLLSPDWHPQAVYEPHLNLFGLAEAFRRWREA